MPKRLLVQTHLSLDELATRYRATTDAVERSHGQIIWLLAQAKSTQAVAEVTGYSVPWIRTLVHRYNQAGPTGLADQRHCNPGGICILSDEQQARLQQALDKRPPDGGWWSGPTVAAWILEQTGRQVHPQRGWEYLKRLQFSQRVLRPRHAKADLAAQEAFKKTCPSSLAAVQQAHPETPVEVWTMDEHRLGLKPVLRRMWVRKGSRPQVRVQPRFHWLSVSRFVCPATGQTEWLLLPTGNTLVFSLALTHFAQAVGAGSTKHILLVLDQAGWQTSQEVAIPQGIQFLFLPPYSPELQPCERLWPLSNEGIANRHFQTLDELEVLQAQRCVALQNQPERIRALTHFHWWPPANSKHQ